MVYYDSEEITIKQGTTMFQRDRNEDIQGKMLLLRALEANDSSTIYATFDTYPIYADDVNRLINIIKNNTYMIALKLLGCNLTREETKKLAEAILENNTLQEVKIEVFKDDTPELQTLMREVNDHLEKNATISHGPRL